jgi:cytochrome c peroxidase
MPTSTPLPPEVTSVLNLPATAFRYSGVVLPAHFQTAAVRALDNTPADNRITDDGATLGRVLFYDRNLSANRTISPAPAATPRPAASPTRPRCRSASRAATQAATR